MRVIGIDPGVQPTAALIDETEARPLFWSDRALSCSGLHGKSQPDVFAFDRLFSDYEPDLIVIEQVWVMPGQGIASSARTVRAGALIEAAALLWGDARVVLVLPHVWKRDFRLLRQDKAASVARAVEMMPASAHFFERKKDHNKAEALLLALWGLWMIARQEAEQSERAS